MKATGIVLAVIGTLMVGSSVSLALTNYNLSNSHDLSKFMGGLGVSLLVLVGGLVMILRAPKTAAATSHTSGNKRSSPPDGAPVPDIHFPCRKCHHPLVTEATNGGASFACPACGAEVVVPLAPRPAGTTSGRRAHHGLAIAALVLGIIGLVPLFGLATGLPALVLGIAALVKGSTAHKRAVAGTVLGGIATLLIPLQIGAIVTLVGLARFSAHQVACASNLTQIGVAVASYREQHGGTYPDTLDQLVREGLLTPEKRQCPFSKKTAAGGHYAYDPVVARLGAGGMLAWDKLSHGAMKQTAVGRNVLLADQSVRFVQESEFSTGLAQFEEKARLARRREEAVTAAQQSRETPALPRPSRESAAVRTPVLPRGTVVRPAPSQKTGSAAMPAPSSVARTPSRPAHPSRTIARQPKANAGLDPAACLADLQSGDTSRMLHTAFKMSCNKPDKPHPELSAALTELVRTSDNTPVRINAIWALAVWGTADCLPVLQAAAGDANSMVRKHAQEAVVKVTKRTASP